MTQHGFFVDWNGDTRRTEATGEFYSCKVIGEHVDVIDSEGFVIHECQFFPTLKSVEAAGVIVNLIENP